jgi:predicted PurR-regulated permease PerM
VLIGFSISEFLASIFAPIIFRVLPNNPVVRMFKKLPTNWKIIFGIASAILLLMLIWFFRAIIAYVIIAIVIAFISEPVADLLKRIRFKRFIFPSWFRAIFALVVFISFFLLLVFVFSPLIRDEINIISQIDAVEIAERISDEFSNDQSVVSGYMDGHTLTEYFVSAMQKLFSPQTIEGMFNNVFGFVGSAIVGLFSTFFIAFFFLKDGYLFARVVFTITPKSQARKMKTILEHTHALLRRYFLGVALQSLIMAVMVGMSLYLIGISNAILIGLFAGIVNVIPYLGPMLGACLGVFIALTTSLHLDFNTAILPLLIRVCAVFGAAQMIDGFVVQPLVLGNSVKAHPLEIFIVILMAGTIGGVIGMVLAIPVYTILRVVAREFLSEYRVVDSLTRDLTETE